MLRISGKVDTAKVERRLMEISRAVTPPLVVRQALTVAVGPTVATIRNRTPRRSGKLSRSTGVRDLRSRPGVQVGWLEPGPTRYGRFVEARRAIVRPTIRQQFSAIADRYAHGLRQELARFKK